MKSIKRKLISLITVMVMLVSQVITYGAETTSVPLLPGEVRVTKEAAPLVVDSKDEWQITLKVEGKDIQLRDTTDVVLVIDRSGSMLEKVEGSTTRAQKTNAAAKGFVGSLLADNTNGINLSIVSFGGYQDNRGTWQINTTVDAGLTNSMSVLNGAIDTALANPKGGTPMKEAITAGGNVLRSGTGKNKIMILLSDGAPTGNSSTVDNTKVNNTIAAAQTVKDTGVKIYTIGVGTDSMPDMTLRAAAQKTLKYCASSVDFYFPVTDTGTALKNVFESIAGEIANATKQVVGVDPMGPNFILKTNNSDGSYAWKQIAGLSPETNALFDFELQKLDIVVSQGKIQYTDGVINWDIGGLTENNPAVLKYRVKMKDPSLGGLHATNGITTISYKDAYGKDVIKSSDKTDEDGFQVPQVGVGAGTIRTIGYLAKEVNGNWVPVDEKGNQVASQSLARKLYNELYIQDNIPYLDFNTYQIVPRDDMTGYKYVEEQKIDTSITISQEQPAKTIYIPYKIQAPTTIKMNINVIGDSYLTAEKVIKESPAATEKYTIRQKMMAVYGSFWLELSQGDLNILPIGTQEKIRKATLYENGVPIQVFTVADTLEEGKIGIISINQDKIWGTKVLVKPKTFGTDNEYYFGVETTSNAIGRTALLKIKVPEPTLFGALKGKVNPNEAFKLYNAQTKGEIAKTAFKVINDNNELKVEISKSEAGVTVKEIKDVKLHIHNGSDTFVIDEWTLNNTYLNNAGGKPYILIVNVNNRSDLDSYFSCNNQAKSPISISIGDKKVETKVVGEKQIEILVNKANEDVLGVTTARVETHVTYIGTPKTAGQVEKIRVLMTTNEGNGAWPSDEYYPVVAELKGLSDSFTDMSMVGTSKLRVNQDMMDIYPEDQTITRPNGKIINENSEAQIFAPGNTGKGGIAGGTVAFKMVKEKDIITYMKSKYSLDGSAAIAKFDDMLAKGDRDLYNIVAVNGQVPFAEGFLIDYIAINYSPQPEGQIVTAPTLTLDYDPTTGNVIVPYSLSDISYIIEVGGAEIREDIETSIVSTFTLTPADGNITFDLSKAKLIISEYDATANKYIYSRTLSDSVGMVVDTVAGDIEITYTEDILDGRKYKISLNFPTKIIDSMRIDDYNSIYVGTPYSINLNTVATVTVEGSDPVTNVEITGVILTYKDFITIK